MGIMRNPEIKRLLWCQFLITVLAVGGAAWFEPFFGLYVFFVCLISSLVYLLYTKRRYDDISLLSAIMDRILHGDYHMDLIPDQEGELAVLTSEIYKVTLRLKEQADALEQEKTYLSESIADISHQIRTPLTSVRMIVPRLTREELTLEERQKYVREVIGLLSRMEWLISALLKIARLESGTAVLKQETVSAASVVQKAVASVEILMDLKEIQYQPTLKGGPVYTGDFEWSVEAVGNVIKNCVEHMPEKGRLEIAAEENPVYTEIVISDTGPGIAPEDLPRLFERFYKGKDSRNDHTGIGLALSRMIISRQNGTIRAENRGEGGAKFTIRFYKGAV